MSSWERARYIPWDRIPTKRGCVSNEFDLDGAKERIFREIQKEAIEYENEQKLNQQQEQMNDDSNTTTLSSGNDYNIRNGTESKLFNSTNSNKKIIIPYSNMDLARQAAFGITLGSITGSLFGFMDSMKSLNESKLLQKTSNSVKFKYLIQGTTRSGLLFGLFFSSYQMLKYGIRITFNDPGDITEIVGASTLSITPLYYYPIYRPALPYSFMLIGMDCFSLYMRKTS